MCRGVGCCLLVCGVSVECLVLPPGRDCVLVCVSCLLVCDRFMFGDVC